MLTKESIIIGITLPVLLILGFFSFKLFLVLLFVTFAALFGYMGVWVVRSPASEWKKPAHRWFALFGAAIMTLMTIVPAILGAFFII